MRFKTKNLVMVLAVALSLVLAGCTGQSSQSSGSASFEDLPVHPDANQPELPDQVANTIKKSLSQDAEINAYGIRQPNRKVTEWYNKSLSEAGYSKEATIERQGNVVVLWKKGDSGVFFQMQKGSGGTQIIVVQDSWQDLEHVKNSAAQAQ